MFTQEDSKEKTNIISKLESINEKFKLPIYYNDDKMELKKEIIDDLELIKPIDETSKSMLEYAFQPTTKIGKKILEQFSTHYTTDIKYLKEHQELLKTYKKIDGEIFSPDFENIIKIWDEIKGDNGFKEKYRYLDWPMWEFLNKDDKFLQLMCMYDMSAPVISLISPFIILIIPFFVIKAKGIKLCWGEYMDVLRVVFGNHPLGKLFTNFSSVSMEQKFYLILGAAFYVFTIYQHILTCIRFHNNMKKMHEYINDLKIYLNYSRLSMQNYLKYSFSLKSFYLFNENMQKQMNVLEELETKLNKISAWKFSFTKLCEFGVVQKYFYEIYCEEKYYDAIMYSFGYNGYIDNLNGIIQNIKNKKINYAKINSQKKAKNNIKNNQFKKAYYPALINKNPIYNDFKFKKNIIITGPNASGKTTALKSSLINIFLSQQIGCGFYKTALLHPYKYIHCYLNIPDTSGRDSLFQAEARRCKEIIDIIDLNKDATHYCAFDELYSGTNPEEAITSAFAFMQYLIKNNNVTCILTTHFIKLCNFLNKNTKIQNYHMKTSIPINTNNEFKYLYKLEKGISNIKGGIKVLSDMNYPEEILENTRKFNILEQ